MRSWILAWLLIGVLLRLAVTFPVHRYLADADCVGVGLTALSILQGETPAFYSGVRLGSLLSYLTAIPSALFGASRLTLAMAPLVGSCLFLVFSHRLYQHLMGPRLASLALPFLALPAPAFVFWTYMPIGYAETMALCALTLLLAVQIAQGRDERWRLFAFGLVAGLGWWNNLITVSCIAPAWLWLAWRRWRLVKSPAFVALTGGGLVLGALPWIIFNLTHSMSSLSSDFATQTVAGPAAMLENAWFVLSHRLPELIATGDPRNGVRAEGAIFDLLRRPVLFLHLAAALFFLWRVKPVAHWRTKVTVEGQRPTHVLLLLVAVTLVVLNMVSAAGSLRELTVRYVLPLYLAVPAALAIGIDSLSRRTRVVAAALGLVILVFNLGSLQLPGSPARQRWEAQAAEDVELVEWLEQHGVDRVAGGYWQTYSLNFLSHERIVAIPLNVLIDRYFEVSHRLTSGKGSRWAVVVTRREMKFLARLEERADLEGEAHRIGRYVVFLPRADLYAGATDEAFMRRLRDGL